MEAPSSKANVVCSACSQNMRKNMIDIYLKNKHPNKSLEGKSKWRPILIKGQGSLLNHGFQSSKPVEEDEARLDVKDPHKMASDDTEEMANDDTEEIEAGKRYFHEKENFPNEKVKRTDASKVENKVDYIATDVKEIKDMIKRLEEKSDVKAKDIYWRKLLMLKPSLGSVEISKK